VADVRVYVAGPIALGPRGQNIQNAISAGEQLLRAGHYPFIPHLNGIWDVMYPGPAEKWLDWDFEWLRQCDALIRLPGESSGSELEIAEATRHGIPIFYSVEEFLKWSM
jgi:hypothetical protein